MVFGSELVKMHHAMLRFRFKGVCPRWPASRWLEVLRSQTGWETARQGEAREIPRMGGIPQARFSALAPSRQKLSERGDAMSP